MNTPATSMAIVLRRNAFLGIAFAVVLLAVAPFMRPVHDPGLLADLARFCW